MKSIELKNIYKTYPDGNSTLEILNNINLSVNSGEFIAIVGPSGSGKSTLLSIIGALLKPSSGQIVIGEEEITNASAKKLTSTRLNDVGFIFQHAELIPYLNVLDQLNLINKLASTKSNITKNKELLSSVGLSDKFKKFPNQLSGGQQQRVAIARALANNPEIILADEPTASLDSKRGREIVQILQKASHTQNKAIIMVTHDERVLDLVDKVYHLEDSQLK